VCIPNLGQPTKVREWAQERHLGEIQNPLALHAFVGSGDKGAAWAIPVAEGNFALSIRGTTQACAVWAQAADPGEVLVLFKQITEGVGSPGIEITVDKDTVSPSPVGETGPIDGQHNHSIFRHPSSIFRGDQIEVFCRGMRVAAHVRSSSNREHTTVREQHPTLPSLRDA
jgi:hypothetical protein